jgi:hypothetical protein
VSHDSNTDDSKARELISGASSLLDRCSIFAACFRFASFTIPNTSPDSRNPACGKTACIFALPSLCRSWDTTNRFAVHRPEVGFSQFEYSIGQIEKWFWTMFDVRSFSSLFLICF